MKLIKKEIEEIAKLYCLGNVKSFKLFSDGWVNYNYALKTDNCKYVVRVLGKKYKGDKRKISEREFGVLDYLSKTNFPYKIPRFIKNIEGKILIKINNKKIWVYEELPGKSKNPITIRKKPVAETAKALAIYHKFIKKYLGKKIIKPDILKEINKIYNVMALVKPKNEADKLMLKNLEMFNMILKKVKKIKFDTEMLMTHSDFTSGNLLFDKENKIIGIIDFENLVYAPKIKDIGHTIKSMCKKDNQKKEFIRIYQKYNNLTKNELRLLPWITLKDNCHYFQLFYNNKVMKGSSKKEKMSKKIGIMNWIIRDTKSLLEEIS